MAPGRPGPKFAADRGTTGQGIPIRGPGHEPAQTIKSALFATRSTASVLGTFGFDRNGNSALKSCGVYKISASGGPALFGTVTPARVAG